MSCYYPSLAIDRGINPLTGKRLIKFLPRRVDYSIKSLREQYDSSLLLLPCGSCLACKCTKAKDWATRAVLEMKYHPASCFLTLTYNDESLPKNARLVKKHLQDFFKHLRNWDYKFRYLACGEYGSTTLRPHYHVILFGIDFSQLYDIEKWSKGSDGSQLYHSEHLDSIWKYGRVIIGEACYDSIAYVARYTTKKVGDDDSFVLASNRPGLGIQYLVDNLDVIIATDKVYGQFGQLNYAPLPRYFNSYLRTNYPDDFQKLVQVRVKTAKLLNLSQQSELFLENLEQVFDYQAASLDGKLKRLKRGDL